MRIFEIVPGVTFSGTATPGATVEVRLALLSHADGAELRYSNDVQADDAGRFSMTVPYSTEPGAPSDVVTRGGYRLWVTGGVRLDTTLVAEIGVPEPMIVAGERLNLGFIERGLVSTEGSGEGGDGH